MKKLLALLFTAVCAFGQHQAVTVLPNGSGVGTFNTPLITDYVMGPFTYDFTASTVIGIQPAAGTVKVTGTPTLNQLAGWTNSNTIQGITLGTNLAITGMTLNASTGSGVPAGSNQQIQYNNSSAFGGTSGLTWNNATTELLNSQSITTIAPLLGISNTNGGTGAAAEFQIGNGTNVVDLLETGTAFSGGLTNGPTGQQGMLYTAGSIPLTFGTNNLAFAYGDTSQNFNVVSSLYVLGGGIVTGGTAYKGTGTVDAIGYYINGVAFNPSGTSTVATIAALKALSVTSLTTGYQTLVQGYYSAGDAAGDRYYTYNSASSATDDGGSVIKPTVGSGRWVLTIPVSSALKPDVSWWGAYGDDSHDDTTAIVNACAWPQAAGGGVLTWGGPTCNYLINPVASQTVASFQNVPVTLAFNGCTITVGTAYTPNSGQYSIIFQFLSCNGVHTGTVNLVSPNLGQQTTATGVYWMAYGATPSGTVGCTNVFAEPIYATGGKACVDIARTPNVQPVTERCQGMFFAGINTVGCYYAFECEHSGDNVTANIFANLAYRSFFVYGVKNVHLNVLDVNHYGSSTIACYNGTGGYANDDPYTQDIDVDYTVLPGTVSRSPGQCILLQANGAPTGSGVNPCHFSNIRIRMNVEESGTYNENGIFATATTINGSPDTVGGRGHYVENFDFSAKVDNATAQENFSFFDTVATGIWTGSYVNNLHIHDMSVLGSASSTIAIYHTPITGEIWENVNNAGALTQTGTANAGTVFTNCFFSGLTYAGYNAILSPIQTTATTASSSATTGAIIDAGGLGVAGNANIGGSTGLFGTASSSSADLIDTTAQTNNAGNRIAFEFLPTSNQTTGSYAGLIAGGLVEAVVGATNSQNWTGSPGVDGLIVEALTTVGGSGTITEMRGVDIANGASGSGTVTKASQLFIRPMSTAGTITNLVGINAASQSSGTNNTDFLFGTNTPPTGNYGLYQGDAYANYLAGNTTVNTGIISAGGSATSGTYESYAPIYVAIKSCTLLTAATPANLATIVLPTGITRYFIPAASSIQCYAETAAGTLAAGTIQLRTATGGGGSQIGSTITPPATVSTMTTTAGSDTAVLTGSTIYLYQTGNSANAGTVSIYIKLVPML